MSGTRSAAGALVIPPGVEAGAAATEIVALANEWHADMIVIGTHGRGFMARAVMGSVAEGVLRHASCPVVVVRSQK